MGKNREEFFNKILISPIFFQENASCQRRFIFKITPLFNWVEIIYQIEWNRRKSYPSRKGRKYKFTDHTSENKYTCTNFLLQNLSILSFCRMFLQFYNSSLMLLLLPVQFRAKYIVEKNSTIAVINSSFPAARVNLPWHHTCTY